MKDIKIWYRVAVACCVQMGQTIPAMSKRTGLSDAQILRIVKQSRVQGLIVEQPEHAVRAAIELLERTS